MRPQEAPRPWKKTLRAESRGVPRGRHKKAPEPDVIRTGSTWWRRHSWLPQDAAREIYETRAVTRRRSGSEAAL